jgi:hypothetical protein
VYHVGSHGPSGIDHLASLTWSFFFLYLEFLRKHIYNLELSISDFYFSGDARRIWIYLKRRGLLPPTDALVDFAHQRSDESDRRGPISMNTLNQNVANCIII